MSSGDIKADRTEPISGTSNGVSTSTDVVSSGESSASEPAPGYSAPRTDIYCFTKDNVLGRVSYASANGEYGDGSSPYQCRPPAAEENGQAVVRPVPVTITTQDFDTFPIEPALPRQERAPHTLKNYNTNFWADPNPQEFTRTINGQHVVLRATPISYTFDYGDGASLGPVTYPGYQLGADVWDQPTDTSHRYADPGDYYFALTTTYRGEYSVDGGPWKVIEGTVSRTSDSQLVRVWRTKVGLVADDCALNSEAWGCSNG
ncbi:MAG: hypothetical protein SPI83_06065 [Rothia sp. (in: high G+C Gram-positive bacteria)]|nr:hypothetical protein [Rothia sp. (in: high G+C Gram-positive bacteria)]